MTSEVTASKAMETQQKAELAAVVAIIGYDGTTDKLISVATGLPVGLVITPGNGLKQDEINAKALRTCAGNAKVATCSGSELTFAAETAAVLAKEVIAEGLY